MLLGNLLSRSRLSRKCPVNEPLTTDPKIIDVIVKTAYSQSFYYVVVDQPLQYVYTRRGHEFNGRHGDFYNFLAGTERKGEAFAGSQFDIELSDGTKFHCQGDVWAVGAPKDHLAVVSGGYASLEQLGRCYVFCSGHVAKHVLDQWLSTHEPCTDYYKYERKQAQS